MAKINAESTLYELRSKFDEGRNFILVPLLSSGARDRVRKGVAPFMFWDYGHYVHLTAESLREAAKHRTGHMIRWDSRKEELGWTEESPYLDFEKETELLNKWADILSIVDSDLMDEPYYKPYWDHIQSTSTRPARFDEKGKPVSYVMEWPESTDEIDRIKAELASHEAAIHNLQVDILVELAENHRYLWD